MINEVNDSNINIIISFPIVFITKKIFKIIFVQIHKKVFQKVHPLYIIIQYNIYWLLSDCLYKQLINACTCKDRIHILLKIFWK